jgi:hypothetical protein
MVELKIYNFYTNIIIIIIFASRIGIVKLFYFYYKTLQRKKKKKDFLALNFRLAVNMLRLIYALKKHNN